MAEFGWAGLQSVAKAAANDSAIPFGPLGPTTGAGRLLTQSNLRGLVKAATLFFALGEFDTKGPEFQNAMKDLLCAPDRCPFVTVFKDHNQISLVLFAQYGGWIRHGALLRWMQEVWRKSIS
jgi:hypothetical protein